MSRVCGICGKPATDFNYGVQSCNACKMFFRRHVVRTLPLKACFFGETCYEITPHISECQFCRFYKCIEAGMTIESLLHKTKFENLINFISDLDYKRNFKLVSCYPLALGLTVATVISGNVQYAARDFKMNFKSWSYISTVSMIDFMKQFPFLYFSKSLDKNLIVKGYFIKLSHFCAAYQTYLVGNTQLQYPDGSDVFIGCGELENRLKCQLVAKLAELKITNEEYLLMLVILFSNPAIPNLSSTTLLLCTAYRNQYTSALFEYCMLNYQKFGPTRFIELLGISSVIAKHYEDVNRYYVLIQLHGWDIGVEEIVKEGLDLL